MTLQQFDHLPKDMQREVVRNSGVFLYGRDGVDVTVKLYQIEGFYVELFFDKRMTHVLRITSFEETEKLTPYLWKIDVSALRSLM